MTLFRKITGSLLSLSAVLSGCATSLPADAQPFDVSPIIPGLPRQQQPIQLQKKELSLEDMLPRANYPVAYLQPVPLRGLQIPGLTPPAIEMLGFNYFVVASNTKYATMSDLYKENRLKGKSNFVTADSIVHPYFAFTNRVLIDAIVKHIAPESAKLARAMLGVSLQDYKNADDSEVRADIECNIAFLSVALKLLDPAFVIPNVGRVPSLSKSDLEALASGAKAKSAIIGWEEDFSAYQPVGWYKLNASLGNFYRCREWISRMSYPLSDVTLEGKGMRGSSFRRSLLLYRALELANVDGQPAYAFWSRVNRAWSLLGTPLPALQEKTITPTDYKSVYKIVPDLKVTLSSLAEPLFRTRLMLSMRKHKPLKLSSTSIFDIDDGGAGSSITASFRLFPVSGDPELPWLRAAARHYKEESESSPSWPLALLVLHAWGAGQANNLLLENAWRLDPRLAQLLPGLERSTLARLPGGQIQPVSDRRWKILSAYFNFLPEGVQPLLRTESWLSRGLESAFAGWVDSHVAVAAPFSDPAPKAPSPPAAASEVTTQPPGRRPRQAPHHYLDPNAEIYRRIREDAQQMVSDLQALGYLDESVKPRFDDFSRLCERLEGIARKEQHGEVITVGDMKLLGSIDFILEKVVVPLAGVLPIASSAGPDKSMRPGVNFALGNPGLLYVILRDEPRTTLARGAVYTYYELAGPAISKAQWQNNLESGLTRQPSWTERFDIVQSSSAHNASLHSKAR